MRDPQPGAHRPQARHRLTTPRRPPSLCCDTLTSSRGPTATGNPRAHPGLPPPPPRGHGAASHRARAPGDLPRPRWFHASVGLDPEDVATVQRQIRRRGLRWLHRHGHLDDAAVHALDAADHAGGWSVEASVSIPEWDRQGLERLVRYCARPPLSLARLGRLDDEHLAYRLRKPTVDGGTELIMTALELPDRPAYPVTPPWRQCRARVPRPTGEWLSCCWSWIRILWCLAAACPIITTSASAGALERRLPARRSHRPPDIPTRSPSGAPSVSEEAA
ncbi:MAG: transposase [Candidatus Krumholzibacteriia bacterium]